MMMRLPARIDIRPFRRSLDSPSCVRCCVGGSVKLRQAAAGTLVAAYLLAWPCGGAGAGPLRQAEAVLDRIAGANALNKVVDKVFTVVTGQAVQVSPELLEKDLKAVMSGDQETLEEWKLEYAMRVRKLANALVDFNPWSFTESAGAGLQGLLEAGAGAAESFAAYEVSALVALGERWFVLTPLIAIPMAIEMSRQRNAKDRAQALAAAAAGAERGEEGAAKALLVRQELKRMALKSELVDMVEAMGEPALQPSRNASSAHRKELQVLLAELQEVSDLEVEPEDVAGDWRLIYVSEAADPRPGAQPESAQFSRIPGVEVRNVRQTVEASSSLPGVSVRNSADISLGPLGVVRVSIQGSWEKANDGQMALVSFDTFSLVPKQILGNSVATNTLPPLSLALPSPLRQTAEWQTVYADDTIRINKGRRQQLFVFQLASPT